MHFAERLPRTPALVPGPLPAGVPLSPTGMPRTPSPGRVLSPIPEGSALSHSNVRDFLLNRKREMQDQQDSLADALKSEVHRRMQAESAAAGFQRTLEDMMAKDNRAEAQNQRLANQLRQLTLQYDESLQIEQRRIDLQDAKSKRYWIQLVEDTEWRFRRDLRDLHEHYMKSMGCAWGLLAQEHHTSSLAMARKEEEAARQQLAAVDLEQQVAELEEALQQSEEAAADSVRDFLHQIKVEVQVNEDTLLQRVAEAEAASAAAEERARSLESHNASLMADLERASAEAAHASAVQAHSARVESSLQGAEAALAEARRQHRAVSADLSRTQLELTDATKHHEHQMKAHALERASAMQELRAECDVAQERNRYLEGRVLGLEGAAHRMRSQIQETAQTMHASLQSRLDDEEEEEEGRVRGRGADGAAGGADSALHEAIKHTQNTLDQMRLRFSTQIESLESQLVQKSSEVTDLRSMLDARETDGTSSTIGDGSSSSHPALQNGTRYSTAVVLASEAIVRERDSEATHQPCSPRSPGGASLDSEVV